MALRSPAAPSIASRAFFRVTQEAWIEARALEREMRRRYPHIDG